ncbi:methyltransferase [Catellatospora sp. IY07-71]|uniref:class I SAM-dependent methyltransferase n=1 Tax=Catellatospora sp. IY07-71 TaxID=2728827 RepID=UPI001BB45E57|nr:class I SAM-dependent methyltransferase [Catellatospora sp. IY07-71]BCJ74392.1 methyltransferase [Catellatospora sp. IY07-71]
MTYEELVGEASRTPFEGWDFGVFHGRYVQGAPSWDYRALVQERLRTTGALLDLGTGGGEFLASLAPLPPVTAATEGFPPNVAVARRRLAPLGVIVHDTTGAPDRLPFPDESFDLVLSRHEAYDPAEVHRVLRPGGVFVTQQVGGRDLEQLNAALGGPPHPFRSWDLASAVTGLEQAGLTVLDRHEQLVPATLHDIGAVVLLLRITPWQIPGYDLDTYTPRLRDLHHRLAAGNPLHVTGHRFLTTARRAPV